MTTGSPIRLAIAQINSTVGDLAGNAERIRAAAEQAAQQGADIVVTPELSLVGYPPEDLLLRDAFYAESALAVARLANALAQHAALYVVVGIPLLIDARRFNAAVVLHRGEIVATYCKAELPNDTVFDEKRYFSAGTDATVFEVKGVRFGLNICEDTWLAAAPARARAAGAQVLLVPNGSPYHMDKQHLRHEVIRRNVCAQGMVAVYANLVGGQDELIFDGNSFVMDASGTVTAQLEQFEEAVTVIDFDGPQPRPGPLAPIGSVEAQVYQALVLGVRDYVGKNGFPSVLIGLSGGVDSALTLAVAVDALGADRVRAVMMPSPYTAEISWIDSREMVEQLGVRYDEIGIARCMAAFDAALAADFAGLAPDTTEENLQARIRGTILMALSNKHGAIVLTTGNKSEMAVGYCTLYGDMAGGFAVLKDIAKTLVYRLCAYRNGVVPVIPQRILTRAPSAELRPDQTDQDSLPPYETLDAIMQLFMEQNRSVGEIVASGFARADVERVTRLIKLNEYKRRQSPIGIRVTHRAFGRDWRYPITSRFSG
ncbi:MAG: NAD+ synthase [Pseudomonadota bacterium]|nr:NAD+ synthase [Pseudomonadota bacterium]